jgi:hypothetical protein
MLSSPGMTGRSSKHRPWVLDCRSKSDASDFDPLISAEVGQAQLRVKPGNDTGNINLLETRADAHTIANHPAPSKPTEIAEFLEAFALHFGAVDIPFAIDADEVEIVEFAELMADAAV